MPKVARDVVLAPNHGILAEVAVFAVALLQVLPLALVRLIVKSTVPLLPEPGLVNLSDLATPLTNAPLPLL